MDNINGIRESASVDNISDISPKTTLTRPVPDRSISLGKSTKSLKAESRAAVLTAFLNHRLKRTAAKSKEGTEKWKVMNACKQEEQLNRERELIDLFNRLSQNKTVLDESKAREHDAKIQEKIQHSRMKVREIRESLGCKTNSVSHKERLQTCCKRRDEVVSVDKERKKQYIEEKLAKSDIVMLRLQESKRQKFQLNRERRDKKTLKSRVQSLLSIETGGNCDRHQKNAVRFSTAIHKDEENTLSKRVKYVFPASRDKQRPLLEKLLPDEVLFNHFGVEELRHVIFNPLSSLFNKDANNNR